MARGRRKGGDIFKEQQQKRKEEVEKLREKGTTRKVLQTLEERLSPPTTPVPSPSPSPVPFGLGGRRKTRRSKKRRVTRRQK
jgi:hypothetical protein